MKKIQGTGVALVTPFKLDGQLDTEALERLVKHVIDGGVDYLVPLGTTGESVTLSKEEKAVVLSTVIRVNADRLPIVLGLGGNNTHELVQQIKGQDFKGVDAILSVSPYYNKPIQEGVYQHYKAVAEASSVPVILYNVPGRTGSNILPETTLRLARDFSNIIAVKEASGNLEQMMSIIKNKPKGFEVISGDDNLTLPLIAAGGIGVISVVANVYSALYSSMVREALAGDFNSAKTKHYQLFDFVNLLFKEGNPSGAKTALQHFGICGDTVRLPLAPVGATTAKEIVLEMQRLS